MPGRLAKSANDRIIAGVCAGIAEHYGIDPTWVRLGFVAAVILYGVGFFAYLVLLVLMPEPEEDAAPATGETASPETEGADIPAPPTAADLAADAPAPPAAAPGMPPAPTDAPRRRGGGVFFGVVLLVAGIALLAQQFAPWVNVFALWPLLIVVPALVGLFRARQVTDAVDRVTTVAIGSILLANSLGYLSWSVWISILSLWPLLIVAAGLALIGRGVGRTWVRVLGQLVVLGGILYGALLMAPASLASPLYLGAGPGRPEAFSSRASVPGSATAGQASIVLGAGRLKLGAGDGLYSVRGRMPEAVQPVTTVSGGGKVVKVMIEPPENVLGPGSAGELGVTLGRSLAWYVDAVPGAASAAFDLRGLATRKVRLAGGLTDLDLIVDDDRDVEVATGIANVVLRVPEEASVRVEVGSGIALVSAPGFERTAGGLPVGGGSWERGQGPDAIRIKIASGIANVVVRTY